MRDASPFVVHGLTVSYFTRKVTGYLDYKGLRWWLRPSIGLNADAMAVGWNGGIRSNGVTRHNPLIMTGPHGGLIARPSAW